jgi:hypothetical protein
MLWKDILKVASEINQHSSSLATRTYEEIDTRAEPELRSFAMVKAVKDIIHLLQEHFEASVVCDNV